MGNPLKVIAASLFLLIIAGSGVGVYFAFHSRLFVVRVVETAVERDPHLSIDQQIPPEFRDIQNLAGIPSGEVPIFPLSLTDLEQKLLNYDWIQEVQIRKRFPETLSVTVRYRTPIALLQLPSGLMRYVDESGFIFGKLDLALNWDLPLISGFSLSEPESFKKAIQILKSWDQRGLKQIAKVASLHQKKDQSIDLLVLYPISGKNSSRTRISFSQNFDGESSDYFDRLSRVLRYLSDRSIPSRQIFEGESKKIVVKRVYRS